MIRLLATALFAFITCGINAQLNVTFTIKKNAAAKINVNGRELDDTVTSFNVSSLAEKNGITIINNSNDNYNAGLFDKSGSTSCVLLVPANKSDSFSINKEGSINKSDNTTCGKITFPFSIKIANAKTKKSKEISVISGNKPNDDTSTQNAAALQKIPFYDALTLTSYFRSDNTAAIKVSEILQFYNNSNHSTDTSLIIASYRQNPFLCEIVKQLYAKSAKVAGIQGGGGFLSFPGNILSSLGGIDVTNFADAFAKFIVKRTKQELNIAFFDKFKEFISKYPDLQTVFPQTYRALTIIGDEIYNYEAYIQTLRESFENDLSALDKNLPSIIPNHPDFFHKHPELAATLNSGCYIAGALADNVHPGDILKDYPVSYLDSLNKNWKGAIQTLQLFSASLRDTATNTDSVYWVSAKQVKNLINDSLAFKIYLGLIYQEAIHKYDSIHYSFKNSDTTLVILLKHLGNTTHFDKDYSSYKNFIVRFSEKADKLNRMIKNYRKPENDSLAFEQYYQYFNTSIDLIQHSTEISKLAYINEILPNLTDSLKDYFDVAHSTADLVIDIKRRNYASAIVNAVHVYDLVKVRPENKERAKTQKIDRKQVKEDVSELVKKAVNDTVTVDNSIIAKAYKQNISTDINDDYSKKQIKKADEEITSDLVRKISRDSSIVLNKTVLDSLRREKLTAAHSKATDDTLNKLYKYGTFMATIVQAKSSDDIEKAIEAFALPTGSSRIKRVSDFNVALNAYAGLYIGSEDIKGVNDEKWINTYGVTAPIGISASWGHRLFWFKSRHEWSTSLYASLIDIGAVAAFRFSNDSTALKSNNPLDTLAVSQSPTVQLKNIVSPGLFLSIGIPKTPLSVNFGAQMGPNLRKITSTNTTAQFNFSDNIYWRYSISLCVDIPVLNFYTKSK